jgi:F-type H+-transporting ATPase subunit epsilon
MKTHILSLQGVVYEGETKLVNAQTLSGEITILSEHQPIISVLKKNSRVYLDDDEQRKTFDITSGFLHLDWDNHLTVLVD